MVVLIEIMRSVLFPLVLPGAGAIAAITSYVDPHRFRDNIRLVGSRGTADLGGVGETRKLGGIERVRHKPGLYTQRRRKCGWDVDTTVSNFR